MYLCVYQSKGKQKTMKSVDFWTNGILGEAVLFPVRYMCLGSICGCAFTWHYDHKCCVVISKQTLQQSY